MNVKTCKAVAIGCRPVTSGRGPEASPNDCEKRLRRVRRRCAQIIWQVVVIVEECFPSPTPVTITITLTSCRFI